MWRTRSRNTIDQAKEATAERTEGEKMHCPTHKVVLSGTIQMSKWLSASEIGPDIGMCDSDNNYGEYFCICVHHCSYKNEGQLGLQSLVSPVESRMGLLFIALINFGYNVLQYLPHSRDYG